MTEHMMKSLTRIAASALVVLGLASGYAATNSAAALLLQVDFTVNFETTSTAENAFGIFDGGTTPVFTGQAVFDFTSATIPASGFANIGNFTSFAHSFSLQTGTQTWGLDDVVIDAVTDISLLDADRVDFLSGNFFSFLISLQDSGASAVFAIEDTLFLDDGDGRTAFCNDCVSFTTTELSELPPVSEVPVPAALPLLLTALAVFGLVRRQNNSTA